MLGMETVTQTLYSRDADGNYPVEVLPTGGYKLVTPGGAKVFESKRQLLIAITGHPKARNWTFDRYFRIDPSSAPSPYHVEPEVSTLEWFSAPVPKRSPVTKVKSTGPGIGVTRAADLAAQVVADADPALGIDLVNRSHEVAKLLFAGFGSWIYSSGYDPEEVLQEVYVGLLVRNNGKCPWDARKSSFGHYVHMVCNGVLSNFHRKRKRIRECEQTGVYGYDEQGDRGLRDVASTELPAPPSSYQQAIEMEQVTDDLLTFIPANSSTYLARKVLPYVRDGYTRTDIARALGVSRTLVMDAVLELQRWAERWAATLN